jgi:hypothetical protein
LTRCSGEIECIDRGIGKLAVFDLDGDALVDDRDPNMAGSVPRPGDDTSSRRVAGQIAIAVSAVPEPRMTTCPGLGPGARLSFPEAFTEKSPYSSKPMPTKPPVTPGSSPLQVSVKGECSWTLTGSSAPHAYPRLPPPAPMLVVVSPSVKKTVNPSPLRLVAP